MISPLIRRETGAVLLRGRAAPPWGAAGRLHQYMPPPGIPAGPSPLLLGDLADDRLGRQQQRRDGRRVLQGGAHDLGGVDHAGLDQVLVRLGEGVEALLRLHLADLAHHHGAFVAGVGRDLAQRLLERAPDDADAHRLVALGLHGLHGLHAAQQRDAAAGHDALLDGRLGRVHRVLDAGLLLLHLGLGGRADLDDRDPAHQLGQPLLELLAVVVGGRLLDLRAELLHAALDVLRLAGALDDAWCCPCRS